MTLQVRCPVVSIVVAANLLNCYGQIWVGHIFIPSTYSRTIATVELSQMVINAWISLIEMRQPRTRQEALENGWFKTRALSFLPNVSDHQISRVGWVSTALCQRRRRLLQPRRRWCHCGERGSVARCCSAVCQKRLQLNYCVFYPQVG